MYNKRYCDTDMLSVIKFRFIWLNINLYGHDIIKNALHYAVEPINELNCINLTMYYVKY